jgi:hypothetical protein
LFFDDDLHAAAGSEMRAVIFAVPVDNLKAGEYRIQLTGIAKSNSEEVSNFKFLAVRH